MPRVYVTGPGRPPASLGCLGSLVVAALVLAALVLIATVGLIVLMIVAAGLVITIVGLVVRRLFHLGNRGTTVPPGGPGGVIDSTATESAPRSAPQLPPEGPDGRHT